MSLTLAQLPALQAAIAAETDVDFVAARNSFNTQVMADFFNVTASPDFYIWRKNYSADQIANAIDVGITQLDALTASKRDSLLWWANRSHDMSLATSQAAVDDLTGSQNTLKNAVLDGGKRKLTRGEKLYSSGTGSLAVPGASAFEGTISASNIVNAIQYGT